MRRPLSRSDIRIQKVPTGFLCPMSNPEVMEMAGIDTSVFKAHSVRGASTSAALDRGVPMQDILATADWSRESTFRRFYYRPKESRGTAFAHKVLASE